MRKIALAFIGMFFISSCSKTETFKGNLYFKLVDFGDFSKLPEEKIVLLENLINSVNNKTKEVSKEEEQIFKSLIQIKKNNLLKTPRIRIKNNNTVRNIYLDKKEYQKLEKYSFGYLRKNHKKIEIELNIKEIYSGVYISDKIINLKEIKGDTPFEK